MSNKLGIQSYDFVEFFTGSAKMMAYWHSQCLGLKIKAYAGPETGIRDRCSYYLEKGNLKIVVTSALKPETYEIHDFVTRHGDGVKRWAVQVEDAFKAFKIATANRAIPVQYPREVRDAKGVLREASIRLYDDMELVFIESSQYHGIFKPGFEEYSHACKAPVDMGIIEIDHIVGNVRENEMEHWADYLNKALDFETFFYFGPGDISTRYSSLLSKVVHDKDNIIKNPINEPFEGIRKSQIEEFIEEFHGSGVQHIALRTDNILHTIKCMRKEGVDFIDIPTSYYKKLRQESKNHKKCKVREDIKDLEKEGLLMDHEGDGYLLQTFTRPISDRPTFFYEIIQRCGNSKGFGHGNFMALYKSIERDQRNRGNLLQKKSHLTQAHQKEK